MNKHSNYSCPGRKNKMSDKAIKWLEEVRAQRKESAGTEEGDIVERMPLHHGHVKDHRRSRKKTMKEDLRTSAERNDKL